MSSYVSIGLPGYAEREDFFLVGGHWESFVRETFMDV